MATNCVCTAGGERVELVRGDVIKKKDFSAGMIDGLLRTGKAIDGEEDLEAPATPAAQDADSWKSTPISDLNLNDTTQANLRAYQLSTVGDVVEYGIENDGFMGIQGVGEKAEEAIVQSLKGKIPEGVL